MSEQREAMALTDAEWTDVLATLPESPETADGWELSLVRRTVERILTERMADAEQRGAARVAAAVEALADEWEAVSVADEWDAADRWSDAPAQLRAALATGAADRVRAEEGDRG